MNKLVIIYANTQIKNTTLLENKLSKLSQEEIEKLNYPVCLREIQSAIQNTTTKETWSPDGFSIEVYQHESGNNAKLTQTLPEMRQEPLSNSLYEASINWISKLDITKKTAIGQYVS